MVCYTEPVFELFDIAHPVLTVALTCGLLFVLWILKRHVRRLRVLQHQIDDILRGMAQLDDEIEILSHSKNLPAVGASGEREAVPGSGDYTVLDEAMGE